MEQFESDVRYHARALSRTQMGAVMHVLSTWSTYMVDVLGVLYVLLRGFGPKWR